MGVMIWNSMIYINTHPLQKKKPNPDYQFFFSFDFTILKVYSCECVWSLFISSSIWYQVEYFFVPLLTNKRKLTLKSETQNDIQWPKGRRKLEKIEQPSIEW